MEAAARRAASKDFNLIKSFEAFLTTTEFSTICGNKTLLMFRDVLSTNIDAFCFLTSMACALTSNELTLNIIIKPSIFFFIIFSYQKF